MKRPPRFLGRFWRMLIPVLASFGSVRAELTVSLDAPPIAPGEAAMLSLTVQNSVGIAGADIVVDLPGFVVAGPAETTPSTADFIIASKPEPGRIRVALARGKGLEAAQAALFKIPLTVAKSATAGTVPLIVRSSRFYSENQTVLRMKALPAFLTIVPPASDGDGDGLPDAWEIQHLGGTQSSGTMDLDGDGFRDAEEFLAATDPRDPGSAFGVVRYGRHESATGPMPMIQWQAREGRKYAIEWSEGPLGPGMIWRRVYSPVFRRDGGLMSWHDDGSRTLVDPWAVPERYYRVVVEYP